MNDKNGFTLIELLFVLSILSILLLLSASLNISNLEKQRVNHFFETLESDFLFIQSLASTTTEDFYIIRFRQDKYEILQGPHKGSIERAFPPGLEIIEKKFNRKMSFTQSGTIREAGTLEFLVKDKKYIAVFQPGKGRFYIAEE
ncbi:hypothetical protein CIL05_13965 [Virgibacillus profundi]|uniref:Competence protein ComG n=1 Tax=Virgibacillus profundi TaxID=2024555 RepID=A0A2A2ICP2_9BACI|nr:competence type IV pilus minor pilin ComGD [Virgibacillus profundi]PAV29076.1 hypothetical protein CIL05_13965 [Virgibacillus profundi]PXY53245.1 prepilin-type N-terminal cleavage/methylation domain-containing protein [Virgibacillus profundi]